jgi:hypothetical protein
MFCYDRTLVRRGSHAGLIARERLESKGSTMTCAVCGATNEKGAGFCYRCGTPLTSSTPAATGPTVSLGRSDPPAFQPGSSGAPVAEESHARVYDTPPSSQSFTVPTPPQYTQPGQYQPNAGAYSTTSNTALIAMVLGIASFLGLSILGAIPAIILGRNAKVEIGASGGRLTGEGMAQAGIILGWINIGLSVLGFCAFCVLPVLLAGVGASVSP